MSEAILHQQVVNYLRAKYPYVLFRTDFAAGIKMTFGQAVKHKRLQACRAWPDIFIAKPSKTYNGLFIELKKDGTKLFKKDDITPTTPHIKEQLDVLQKLNLLGYFVEMAIGYQAACEVIDWYLDPIVDTSGNQL